MNDRDFELLSAYLDDELSNEERIALEARLENEADLRRELELFRATISLVGSLPLLKAPRDFTLKAPPLAIAPKVSILPRLVSLASAAAAVLLFVAGIGVLNTGSTMQPLTSSTARDIAALPSATQILPTVVPLTSTPLPTLSPVLEQLDYASAAPAQPELQLQVVPDEEPSAVGQSSAAVTSPTDGEAADAFITGSAAQESMEISAGGAAPESSSGLAANAAPEKTPTPAFTSQAGFFAQATQLPPATASPMPTQTITPEPPTQVAQARTEAEAAPTAEGIEAGVLEDATMQRVAPAESSDSTLGIVLLLSGALLMLIAIGLFLRSRRPASIP